MSNKRQKGFIGGLVTVIFFLAFVFAVLTVSFKTSNEVVSGIAYNTTNDSLIMGTTKFSVRASESTYTTSENVSSYCLPKGSPYIPLVNEAAQNKDIKIAVHANKYFAFKAPWVCQDNVTVERIK